MLRHCMHVLVVISSAVLFNSACAGPGPEAGIEPLPDDLEVVATHVPQKHPIEGRGLCWLVESDNADTAEETLAILSHHLLINKDWTENPLVEQRSNKISLNMPGARGLIAGTLEGISTRAGGFGDQCRPIEEIAHQYPDSVYINIYSWPDR